MPLSEVPLPITLQAAADPKALLTLVQTIQGAIRSVDEDFVALRTAMLLSAEDPRLIGKNVYPREPSNVSFNTWRRFGADAVFRIPGMFHGKPDAIRPVQGRMGARGSLVLPGSEDQKEYELAVYLPESAMKLLKADREWMKWVHKVIQ
jgi:hypothetical protein